MVAATGAGAGSLELAGGRRQASIGRPSTGDEAVGALEVDIRDGDT